MKTSLFALIISILSFTTSLSSANDVTDINTSHFSFVNAESGIGYITAIDVPNNAGGFDTMSMVIETVADTDTITFRILYYSPLLEIPPKGTRAVCNIEHNTITLPRIDIIEANKTSHYSAEFSVSLDNNDKFLIHLTDYKALAETEVKSLDAQFLGKNINEPVKPLTIKQVPIGRGWDDVYTFPEINNREFYRATIRTFDLLELNFTPNNSPIKPIMNGDSLMIRAILPPGISYAAISGESNDWQGTVPGTYPVMLATNENPNDFCIRGGEDCTSPEDMTRTTAALNRPLYGNATPNFPVKTEASEVYFVLYNPRGNTIVKLSTLRIVMLVADRELYENWRAKYLP